MAYWSLTISSSSPFCSLYKKRLQLSIKEIKFLNSSVEVIKTFIHFFYCDRIRHRSIRREWLQGVVAITRIPFYPRRQTPCNSQSASREGESILKKKLWLHKTWLCSFFLSLFIYLFIFIFSFLSFFFPFLFLFWQINQGTTYKTYTTFTFTKVDKVIHRNISLKGY